MRRFLPATNLIIPVSIVVLLTGMVRHPKSTNASDKPFTRTIDLKTADTSLRALIVSSLEAGTLHVYSDAGLTVAIPFTQVQPLLERHTAIDTLRFEDVAKQEEIDVEITSEYDFYRYTAYQVAGVVHLDKKLKKKEVRFRAFAPAVGHKSIPGQYAKLKLLSPESKALFWIDYNEMLPILDLYDDGHKGNTVGSLLEHVRAEMSK